MDTVDPTEYVRKVIELHGGNEKFYSLMEERWRAFNEIWNQDAHSIGRVQRSHLAVEHYLTKFLVSANPRLGSQEDARLSFSQRVELLPDDDPSISFLKPGLRRLNAIRNRMVHRLRVDVSMEDRDAFLGIQLFAAFCEAGDRREGPGPDDPLPVLEHFAFFAASLFDAASASDRNLWSVAAESPDDVSVPRPASGTDEM